MNAEVSLVASWDHHNPPRVLHDPNDATGIVHQIAIPGPATLTVVEYTPGDNQGGFSDATAQLLIGFSVGVASGVTANFLWEQLKAGHLRLLRIAGKEIRGPEFGGASDAEVIQKLTAILDQHVQELRELRGEREAESADVPPDEASVPAEGNPEPDKSEPSEK